MLAENSTYLDYKWYMCCDICSIIKTLIVHTWSIIQTWIVHTWTVLQVWVVHNT